MTAEEAIGFLMEHLPVSRLETPPNEVLGEQVEDYHYALVSAWGGAISNSEAAMRLKVYEEEEGALERADDELLEGEGFIPCLLIDLDTELAHILEFEATPNQDGQVLSVYF